ncbi:MAG: phosphatase PAP2 family protein [Prevotellaceae bacterium]|jgi:membrane-associated phospholipid phosphatase|nr:phosphatase PAP2 family protein [Prevotellaceae bacterium]
MRIRSLTGHFNSVELLTFAYILITAACILTLFGIHTQTCTLLFYRIAFFTAVCLMAFISEKSGNKFVNYIRYLFPFSLIAYWYPETYYLAHPDNTGLPESIFLPNLDSFFEHLDVAIFGCSPAIEFSKAFPQSVVSEIMYFGYFSYYLLFLFTFTYFFFVKPDMADRAMFYCLCSFFIFYAIFTLVPVAGPQFYYSFPDSQVPDGYFFCSLMRWLQFEGEMPTGAFPSSHVGLTLIVMILLFQNARKYFYIILPVAIILTAATVYIKAHYLVDVLAAFIAAPLILALSKSLFRLTVSD